MICIASEVTLFTQPSANLRVVISVQHLIVSLSRLLRPASPFPNVFCTGLHVVKQSCLFLVLFWAEQI